MMILFIVLGVLAVVFILQNSESHEINFLFLDFRAAAVGDPARHPGARRGARPVAAVLDEAAQGAPAAAAD